MSILLRAIRAYPIVAVTLAVGAGTLIMLATPSRDVAPFIAGGSALCVASWQAVEMVRSLLRGNLGLDVLAVTAITAAVLVGEPWAAIIVVLMLTGGEALEDYAEKRSKRELTALLSPAAAAGDTIAAIGGRGGGHCRRGWILPRRSTQRSWCGSREQNRGHRPLK